MKKVIILLCISVFVYSSFGCSVGALNSAGGEEEGYTDTGRADVPFMISLDKQALESGSMEKATVTIGTDLKDWSYSVTAEYGVIENMQEMSFDYRRPEDGKYDKDTITLEFTDEDNGSIYSIGIPLRFDSV